MGRELAGIPNIEKKNQCSKSKDWKSTEKNCAQLSHSSLFN